VSRAAAKTATRSSIEDRVARIDWQAMRASLDDRGYATTGPLLSKAEVRALRESYGQDDLFRSRVVMRRHGFGEGEYKYFRYPLPRLIAEMREAIYPELAPLATEWHRQLKLPRSFPKNLGEYLKTCHVEGQTRPTPLLLKYGPGDFNRLHQDLYGPLTFPIQSTFLLSEPGEEFDGGEFTLVEQRPRSQSRVEVVPLRCGEAVFFAVNWRPAQGTRGFFRLTMRHGVSRIRSGARYALGIIFHDAA
jgi:hypothetical protein